MTIKYTIFKFIDITKQKYTRNDIRKRNAKIQQLVSQCIQYTIYIAQVKHC